MTGGQLRGLIAAVDPDVQAIGWSTDLDAQRLGGIAYDSRQVVSHGVFFGLRGEHADGASFAGQAVARGASLIVAESMPAPALERPWLIVRDARRTLAAAAAAWYGHPSRQMQVVGITGTNGKTTTAYLMAAIFEAAGASCGLLGTVAYRIGKQEREATRTTPEAPDVQRMLREMADAGCGAAVMEASSHALALHRVDDIRFAAAIFTNLTREHLDYHHDMDRYFAAKRRLFDMLEPGVPAVVNLDDPRGPELAASVSQPVTYGIDRRADIMPGPLSFSLEGLRFEIRTPRGSLNVASPLVGRPNVYNILAAVGAATALDIPFAEIERGVASLARVPGRFQVVSDAADEITVLVDYAHTDDALRNLLETARPLSSGRLITVFGCGGDRDRSKRPLMGAVAARLSDVVIVTSDNPRSEDPQRIIEEIQRGLAAGAARDPKREPAAQLAIVDRRAAILKAVQLARAGDLVLVAGKGHEKTQVIGDRALPFDDVAVATEALAGRRGAGGVARRAPAERR
jgi:UDP-N-acetylmuramoyl-L-alanyl-D-glutamate--2,6-diaminopimelate ligase